MGYYSEVAICMAFEDEAKRDAFWELLRLRKDEIGEVIKYCDVSADQPWITYHDTSMKWYESHPTRLALEGKGGILDLVVECGGAWHMLRLGEDSSDVEQNGDEAEDGKVHEPTDAFYMVRHIEWA